MNTIITWPSAYSFWKNNNPEILETNTKDFHENPAALRSSSSLFSQFAKSFGIELPLHLMVLQSRNRRTVADVCWHVAPSNFPEGSIVKIDADVWIASPEFVFLLAAREQSLARLVVTGNFLCGTYYFSDGVQKARLPLTSMQKLKRYVESAANVTGVQSARRALRYVVEHCNSPMESKLAACGALPLSCGGFALLPPKMNFDVPLAEEGQRILQRKSCCCDMVWPEHKLIVEYDSQQFHLNTEQFAYDKRRSSALNVSGYRVISVTNANLRNPQLIEELFLLIRRALQMPERKDRFAKYKDLRRETIKEIFYESRLERSLPAS